RGAPTSTTLPLTLSMDTSAGATPTTSMSAATESISRSARSGTITCSRVGPVLSPDRKPSPPRRGYFTRTLRLRLSPSISSFSTPSPSEPVIRTSARSQASTSIRPLRLSISIRPLGSSARVSSIGVSAQAAVAATSRAKAMDGARIRWRTVFMAGLRSTEGGALRERKPLGIGAAQLLQEQSRVGVVGKRVEDETGAAVQLVQGGAVGVVAVWRDPGGAEFHERGVVLPRHAGNFALDQRGRHRVVRTGDLDGDRLAGLPPAGNPDHREQACRQCHRKDETVATGRGQRAHQCGFDAGPQIAVGRLVAAQRPQLPAQRVARRVVAQVVVVIVHACAPSRSRNRLRARCNCALELPTAMPSSVAISSCFQPSTSYSTSTALARGGRLATARSKSIDSAVVWPAESVAPSSSKASSSPSSCGRERRLRNSISAVLTANRWSHVENAASYRNSGNACHART